jgi:uncharacterized phage protein (TIGR01671 family)
MVSAMREIKFRAWDIERRKYLPPETDFITWPKPSNWRDFYEVEQFTGLKDNNGNDIYEGDICRVLYTDWVSKPFDDIRTLDQYLYDIAYTMKVEFVHSCFEFVINDDKWSMYVGEHGRIIVIGNIHENPGLLK